MLSQQRGKATYYSKRATGSRTSDGSRLHHDSLTCAHKTYAFGTMLKVTNLDNNKSVIVKVTDRGPYTRGRIIDLSYRAASEIGMISKGVALVEIQVVKDNIVPLKLPEEKYQLLDFEFAESEIDYHHPQWQQHDSHPSKETKEAHEQKKEAESSAPKKHMIVTKK